MVDGGPIRRRAGSSVRTEGVSQATISMSVRTEGQEGVTGWLGIIFVSLQKPDFGGLSDNFFWQIHSCSPIDWERFFFVFVFFHYHMQKRHYKMLSAVFQITLMHFMIAFTYRHATHLNFSHSVSVSVSAVLFLSDRWQCCSSTENHLMVWFVSCKHFHSVIVQFEPIRMHFWQIRGYMKIEMKEALQVMKVGNMYHEEDFQIGK